MKAARILAVIIALVVLSSFSACILKGLGTPSPYSGDQWPLYTMAAFSIPDVEQMGTKINVIEEDQEGRILFEVIFGKKAFYYKDYGTDDLHIYAYAISQQYDERYVYYYEDICFAVFQNETDFLQEEQESLKEKNDWNKPLDYSAMTRKTILSEESKGNRFPYSSVEYDRAMSIQDVQAKELFMKTIDVSDNEVYCDILDIDRQDRLLIIVNVLKHINREHIDSESIHAYFMIYDTKNTQTVTPIEEIEDIKSFTDQLGVFKAENGWESEQSDKGTVLLTTSAVF